MKTRLELMKDARAILQEIQNRIPYSEQTHELRHARVQWNHRCTKAAGRAWTGHGPKGGLVELSTSIFDRAENQAGLRNTVLHEIAHLMAPGAHHGPAWKRAALSIGCTAERCHNFTTNDAGSRRNYPVQCARCGHGFDVGAVRAAKILSGSAIYRHRGCGGQLVIDSAGITQDQLTRLRNSKTAGGPSISRTRRRKNSTLDDLLGGGF